MIDRKLPMRGIERMVTVGISCASSSLLPVLPVYVRDRFSSRNISVSLPPVRSVL